MKERSTEAARAEARAAEAEEERLVRAVLDEFEARRDARRLLERSWELNMNFLAGNQYCDIGPAGELEEEQPRFYWQSRRVFNHIAPAIDTRCAKLAQVRPVPGEDELVLSTSGGMVIKFPLAEVPELKKNSRGVRGMKLEDGDRLEHAYFAVFDKTMEYRGKEVALGRLKLSKRDGKGTKIRLDRS